jgi:NAD(P)-dependent dehydrogenase (short-subunit alcohol dehydrogenase family)
MSEQQKSVLITGASGGIGSATARRLDELGWEVFAGVRRREAGKSLARSGKSIRAVELEITDAGSVAAASRQIQETLEGRGLDGLVNNAGIIVQGPIELVPLDAWRRQFEVNVIGQIAVTQAFLPALRAVGGRVVNIGAASGLVTVPMFAPISASKTALESLTDALRMELKHQGVAVSIVDPGAMETDIFAKAATAGAEDGFAGGPEAQRVYAGAIESFERAVLGQKFGAPDSVAKVIVKALTDRRPAARYVVGRDARQVSMLRHLPTRIRDRLLMSTLGLRREAFGESAARRAPGA